MQSLRELFRIGQGPSSSHTMAPRRAAAQFLAAWPTAFRYRVTLFGSLAATGRGHLTDQALAGAFAGRNWSLDWRPEEVLPLHSNGMRLEAFDDADGLLQRWEVYSTGGGPCSIRGNRRSGPVPIR